MTTKTKHRRWALRAAVKIHEHLLGPAHRPPLNDLPQAAWDELRRTVERLRYVQRRSWRVAAQSLCDDLHYSCGCVQRHLEWFREQLPSKSAPQQVAAPSEIAADLQALEQEFEDAELHLKEHNVSVLTAPIVLEDVELGSFRIVLYWERIGQTRAYDVIAEEAHAAEGNSDVTHPHVRDQTLCEGEGTAAIKAALSEGRLLDFFVLVRQVLETYNSSSTHVMLSNWNGGASCQGCGTSLSDDDYSTCERCSDVVCNDCSNGCSSCSRYVCSGCSAECAECENQFCLACLTEAEGTGRQLCETCLEKQRKEQSDEAITETVEAESADPLQPPATPAADPICVGETPASPRPRRNRSGRVRSQQPRQPAARGRRAARPAAVHAGNR